MADRMADDRGYTAEVVAERVAWRILENRFDFTAGHSEWTGTTVVFGITPVGHQTRLRFAHLGLLPDRESFNVCSNAWSFYITEGLRHLIATGVGRPNPKEQQ